MEAAPSADAIRTFDASTTMVHVAGRLITTLRGLLDESAPPPEAAASTAADVDMTAEDVDADEAGGLDPSATNVLQPDGDMPLLPDAETTSRLLPVDPEDVIVARRPRWRAASLLSGLTCEGRHVTPEWPTPHPCGRFTSCPYCYYQVCRRDSHNRRESRAVAWELMKALKTAAAIFVGGDLVQAVILIARRLRSGFLAVALACWRLQRELC